MLIQPLTDLDVESGLLAHLALQRRAVVLAGIGPAPGQVPFAALVEQQQHAAVVEDDALDRERVVGHRLFAGSAPRHSSGAHLMSMMRHWSGALPAKRPGI